MSLANAPKPINPWLLIPSFFKVLNAAINENFIGKLISLGAVMNLICFFYFLKINNDNKAAGVLSATVIVAIFTFLIKL